MQTGPFEALLLLATLFSLHGKSAKAAALLEGLHELRPEDTRVARLLCLSLLEEGLSERALSLLEILLGPNALPRHSSDRVCALRLRASALLKLGRPDEARTALDESAVELAA
jgi:Flp pilus assembly protein TadD